MAFYLKQVKKMLLNEIFILRKLISFPFGFFFIKRLGYNKQHAFTFLRDLIYTKCKCKISLIRVIYRILSRQTK